MIEQGLSHCQAVTEALNGERAVDEQTFGSLAVLRERLERLRLDKRFAGVRFSSAVKKLAERKEAALVV